MKTFEELFTAWTDGRLEGAELAAFEKELTNNHPEAAAERDQAHRLGDLLRRHSPPPALRNEDFFVHQILQRIDDEERAELRTQERLGSGERDGRGAESVQILLFLRRFALAGLAVCLLLAGLGILLQPQPGRPRRVLASANVLSSRTMTTAVSAVPVKAGSGQVTVLWLNGLDWIPTDRQLIPQG